ncbi:Lnb N-terminal periplasmic domain-containing protein [Parasedimentitalea denitrificans]
MTKILNVLLIATLILGLTILTAWAALALWYRLPFGMPIRAISAGGFALLGLSVIASLFRPSRLRALATYCLALATTLFWWTTLTPPSQANWAPDVARQVTGELNGDQLTLTNVRNFDWQTPTEATERWETRSYDLADLQGVDLFMSYWAGPQMAHMIVSFDFADADPIAWSVEVRRQVGGGFSPIADLFKSNTLVIIAADERDVVGTRSNVRGEDVQLYRIDTTPEKARALLLKYVQASNRLAAQPHWYNSLLTNCTTVVLDMIRTIVNEVPLDWRVVANGYLPEYAYDRGVLDSRLTLTELRDRSHINAAAKAHGLTAGFSAAIRQDLPKP